MNGEKSLQIRSVRGVEAHACRRGVEGGKTFLEAACCSVQGGGRGGLGESEEAVECIEGVRSEGVESPEATFPSSFVPPLPFFLFRKFERLEKRQSRRKSKEWPRERGVEASFS